MPRTTHLNALQALEMAVREKSLRGAAEQLGITPAAVGQRIRSLEQYLDTDLLLRGRSGLQPTPALRAALDDLQLAFAALDRVSDALDFQRTAEIHIVADPDWAELWLLPRLARFREAHPGILFNVNGEGDIPMRLGAADLIVDRDPDGKAKDGAPLYVERFAPVASPDNKARFDDPVHHPSGTAGAKYLPVGRLDDRTRLWRHHERESLEGFPLLHLKPRTNRPAPPTWPDFLARFGFPRDAPERGVQYTHVRHALDGVRSDAGFFVCPISFVLDDLESGALHLLFAPEAHVVAEHPYRMHFRAQALARPQITRFRDWLEDEARETERRLALMLGA